MKISSEDPVADEDVDQAGSIIWKYYKINGVQSSMVEPKILHAPFAILLSLGVLQLELLLIFLVELFSDKSY